MSKLASHKKLIYVLIPFALTLGMALDIYLPSIPRISGSLSTSIEMVQWTMSSFFLCFGIGQLFVGPISDQIGRKRTVFISIILYTLGSIFAAISPSVEILILSRCIQAFGACGTQISAFSIAKDSIKDKDISEQVFIYLKGSMGFAPMIAPIIGSFLDYHFSWRASFMLLTLFGMTLIILDYKWIEESLEESKRVKFKLSFLLSYFTMLRDMRFVSLAMCVIASQAILFSFFSLSPHIVITKLGYTQKHFGLLFATNALTYTIASIISARSISRIGGKSCIMIGGCLMLFAGTSLLLITTYSHINIITLMIPTLLASSGTSFVLGPATSMAIDLYRRTTGTVTAFIGSIEAASAAIIGNFAVSVSAFDGNIFSYIVLLAGLVTLVFINFFQTNK